MNHTQYRILATLCRVLIPFSILYGIETHGNSIPFLVIPACLFAAGAWFWEGGGP